MSYKNSVKLITSNFSIVWKQLLYMLIVVLIMFGISYGIAYPTINVLKQEGVFAEFGKIFETIYTAPNDIIAALSTAALHFVDVLTINFSKIWLSVLGVFLVSGMAFQILKNISMYNISSVMYMKLTSNVELGYTRNMISTLGQSIRYGFAKWVINIPFTALRLLFLFLYFKLINSVLTILIGLFIIILLLVLLSAIELTFFTGMAAKMLDNNGNLSAFKAFREGNSIVFKKFARVFSNAIIVCLTLIFINMFLGLFTIGVALLITLPASMVFINIFELTSYFGAKGERYYLTSSTIATPVTSESEKI